LEPLQQGKDVTFHKQVKLRERKRERKAVAATVPQRGWNGVCLVLCQQAEELNGFHVPSGPEPLVPRRPAGIGWKLGMFFPWFAGLCAMLRPRIHPHCGVAGQHWLMVRRGLCRLQIGNHAKAEVHGR